MESKLLWTVAHEWFSLVTGNDAQASVIVSHIQGAFTTNQDEHFRLPPPVVEQLVILLTSPETSSLPHAELDENWRAGIVRSLFTLASKGVNFETLTRSCRSRINYQVGAGVTLETVLELNLQAYRRFEKELQRGLQEMEDSEKGPDGLLKQVALFKLQTNCRRLLRWMERAVLVDMIRPVEHQLSSEAQRRLEQFRIAPLTRSVPDRTAQIIFEAVDRRSLWTNLECLMIAEDELATTMLAVAQTVTRIRKQEWEGSLVQEVLYGVDDKLFEDHDFVYEEFRELDEWASAAQVFYEQGLSVSQAIERTKLLKLRQSEIEGFMLPRGQPSGKVSAEGGTEIVKTGGDFLRELARDFGVDNVQEFDSINLGLTGVIEAKKGVIAAKLREAYARDASIDADVKRDWQASFQRTDVKLVALSYKHMSKSVRMGERTMEKVAAVLEIVAQSEGCEKVDIWLDAILSKNKKLTANWAVRGLYPYLICDVISFWGDDGEYCDHNASSMWMRVEDLCADEKTKIFATLEDSSRGWSFQRFPAYYALQSVARLPASEYSKESAATVLKHSSKIREVEGRGQASVKERMMTTAKELCKGAIVGTLASWASEKRMLLLWAELCMLKNRPVLFGADGLEDLETLQADNLTGAQITEYLLKARDRGFVERGSSRERGIQGDWRGAFELLPGLVEASRRELVPLLPAAEEKVRERIVMDGEICAEVVSVGLGGMLISIELDSQGHVRNVWVDVNGAFLNARENSQYVFNSARAKEGTGLEKVVVELENEDEKKWVQSGWGVGKGV